MILQRACGVLVAMAGAAFAQTAPVFEVASVKPSSPDARMLDFRVQPGGRLDVMNQTLRIIIMQAYNVKGYQLAGGPSWLDTDRFDIEAKAADGNATRDQVMAMLQTLLAERFGLKVHRDSREGDIYALVVGKNGPKLQPPTGDRPYIGLYRLTPPQLPGINYALGAKKTTMTQFAERLSSEVHRTVLNRTGLDGEFDFRVEYSIDDNPETGPSIFIALQEQLGLKLDTTKGPIETLVIERASKPTAN
jgi:uncharacterized protein (TIGR03435 family)